MAYYDKSDDDNTDAQYDLPPHETSSSEPPNSCTFNSGFSMKAPHPARRQEMEDSTRRSNSAYETWKSRKPDSTSSPQKLGGATLSEAEMKRQRIQRFGVDKRHKRASAVNKAKQDETRKFEEHKARQRLKAQKLSAKEQEKRERNHPHMIAKRMEKLSLNKMSKEEDEAMKKWGKSGRDSPSKDALVEKWLALVIEFGLLDKVQVIELKGSAEYLVKCSEKEIHQLSTQTDIDPAILIHIWTKLKNQTA